jgi:Cu/Zn superoxide dismutase
MHFHLYQILELAFVAHSGADNHVTHSEQVGMGGAVKDSVGWQGAIYI